MTLTPHPATSISATTSHAGARAFAAAATAAATIAMPATAADDPWAAATVTPAPGPTTETADPWSSATTSTTADTAQTSHAATNAAPATTASADWLQSPDPATTADTPAPTLWEQITTGSLPVENWINDGLGWAVEHLRPFFQTVRIPIDATLSGVEQLLLTLPWPVLTVLVALLAWQFAGRGLALGAGLSLTAIAVLGIWPQAMVTLSLVLTSLVFCIVIGLPLGIVLASSDRAQRWMRPVLDAMQTTPAFVYLVPVVMLFGIGNVPGVIVTIIFALPPLVRLTNLGIRQVRPDLIEASRAYGASPWQLLWKVQLPLAMPNIMAGINQSLMLSLSMVVIASMIAVGGLGQMVLRGIGRLDMGLATVGGLGIVLLAIVLDRITQAMGTPRRGHARWWQTGPLGWLLSRLSPATPTQPAGPQQGQPH